MPGDSECSPDHTEVFVRQDEGKVEVVALVPTIEVGGQLGLRVRVGQLEICPVESTDDVVAEEVLLQQCGDWGHRDMPSKRSSKGDSSGGDGPRDGRDVTATHGTKEQHGGVVESPVEVHQELVKERELELVGLVDCGRATVVCECCEEIRELEFILKIKIKEF